MYAAHLLPHHNIECQQSISDCLRCALDNPTAIHRNYHMMVMLAIFLGKFNANDIAATDQKYASMEHQRLFVLHLE
jgi:hypothetical protein